MCLHDAGAVEVRPAPEPLATVSVVLVTLGCRRSGVSMVPEPPARCTERGRNALVTAWEVSDVAGDDRGGWCGASMLPSGMRGPRWVPRQPS